MRISGITIPDKKQLEFGLTAIYGIGRSRARYILKSAGIKIEAHPKDISLEDENRIRREIEQYIAIATNNLALLDNGMRPSGTIETPEGESLTDEQFESLREQVVNFYSGGANAAAG